MTLEKLAPGNNSGFLYYNSSNESYNYYDVGGFSFLGSKDVASFLAVLNSGDFSSYSSGDFFVISDNSAVGSVPFYGEGDWVVFAGDGNGGGEWLKIQYQGKILDIAGRKKHFQFAYGDYSWSQVITRPYIIDNSDGTINDQNNISSILELGNVNSSGVPSDGQVLKWDGTNWYIADDNESSTSLDGSLLRNVENSNFAANANLSQTKVNGLSAELAGKVDLSSPAITSGNLEFTNNFGFINIQNISSGNGNSIALNNLGVTLQGHLNSLNAKQNLIGPPVNSNFNGVYFLSGNLTFEELSTSVVPEGVLNLYFTGDRLLASTLRAQDIDGKTSGQSPADFDDNTNLAVGLSLGETLDILQYKIKNRFISSTGTPNVQITNDNISNGAIDESLLDSTGLSGSDNVLYYDGSNWSVINHPGTLSYQGELINNNSQLISPAYEGMFYIANLEGQTVSSIQINTITLHHSDWLIYLEGSWKKLTNSSPITNLNFGIQAGANSGEYASQAGDLTYNQIENFSSNSLLSEFYNVEGSATENNIIQWNGTKWVFADDNQGADEINGNQLSNSINLTADHLNISNGELSKSHLRNYPDHYLKIDPSGQVIMRACRNRWKYYH